jgi:hypothetical protein
MQLQRPTAAFSISAKKFSDNVTPAATNKVNASNDKSIENENIS